MKHKIILTLLLITLVVIAIISGCGGGNDNIHPVSLFTPTPNYSGTGNIAYITFNVDWPKNGKAGKLYTVSKDGKQMTASIIPGKTKLIAIYVLNYQGYPTPNPTPSPAPWDKVVGYGSITNITSTITIPVRIGNPQNTPGQVPALPVRIYAAAYNDTDDKKGKVIAWSDSHNPKTYMQLKVGNQEGDVTLCQQNKITTWVAPHGTPKPRSIITHDTGSSSQWDINANLQLLFGTPFPINTPMPSTSDPNSEPDPGQTIYFKVIQGSGTLDSDNATTDPNGNCTVHFTQNETGPAIIEASYQYDSTDANTTVTARCNIGEGYILTVAAKDPTLNLSKQAKISANSIPSWTPIPGRTGGQITYQQPIQNDRNIIANAIMPTATPTPVSTDITATLMLALPTPQPVANKLITFKIKQGDDGSTNLSSANNTGTTVSGYTLNDGTSTVTLSTTTSGDKVIEASFQVDPNDPNSRIYSAQCDVNVNAPTPTPIPPTPAPVPELTFSGISGNIGPMPYFYYISIALPDGSYSWSWGYYPDYNHSGCPLHCSTKLRDQYGTELAVANQTVNFVITQHFPGGSDYWVANESVDPSSNTTDVYGNCTSYYNIDLHTFNFWGWYNAHYLPTATVIITATWAPESGPAISKDVTLNFGSNPPPPTPTLTPTAKRY